jgi:hypothetical protein
MAAEANSAGQFSRKSICSADRDATRKPPLKLHKTVTSNFMKTLANYIATVLMTVFFCSCGQQKKETVDKEADHQILTDSAKIEQYFQWTSNIDYIKAYEYDLSVLPSLEKNRDTVMLLDFLITNFDIVKLFTDFPYQPADLVESVYAIDFNGDDMLDIIYNGGSGGEPNITQVFLNKGDHYKKVFAGYQDIIKADYSNNRINSFTLINPGCCADPQIVEYYYSVTYFENEPTFNLDKTIGYLSQTEKPQRLFSETREFAVKTDNSKLRSDCYLLDNVEHPVYGGNGNAIATYNSGSKGIALGIKGDNGVEWIYAILNSNNKINNCDFPSFLEHPTEIRGWILKTDIEWK